MSTRTNTLGSAAFTVAFYCWTIFLALALAVTLVLPRSVLRAGVSLWAAGNAFLLRHLAGIRLEVRGQENILPPPVIIASKHQSEWEANAFLTLLYDPVYIVKKELVRIPLYGLFVYRMKMIVIDREGHARTLKQMLRQARETVEAKRPLVIFPEGTRVDPGQYLPYRIGVAALYSELGVPVVPVVHNTGLHWPKQTFRKVPGTIVLQFLPPIQPGLSRHEFMARLENTMESAWAKLYAESKMGQPIEKTEELRRAVSN